MFSDNRASAKWFYLQPEAAKGDLAFFSSKVAQARWHFVVLHTSFGSGGGLEYLQAALRTNCYCQTN